MAVNSPLLKELKRGYSLVFEKQWPPLVGGLLIGLLAIMIEAWSRPWGIVAGIRNWADWLFYGVGLYAQKPDNPFLFSPSVMDLGLILGSLAAALLAKEFACKGLRSSKQLRAWWGGCLWEWAPRWLWDATSGLFSLLWSTCPPTLF